MFIHNFKAKDFGCLEDIDISFSKMNLIMGDNGSGKSKLVSAIVYSVCDYLDEKILDYVRTGSDKFYIENTFSHVGNNYNIKITGSSKGSDKILTVNDSDVYKNTQAVEYIEKYIHNPKLTLASAITMQGKGSDILFEPNQKRIERLKQIFNIEKLNYVGMYLKDQIDELKVQIKELETENNVLNNTEYNYKTLPQLPDEKNISEIKLVKLGLEKEKSDYEKNKILYDLYCKELKIYEDAQTKLIALQENIITIQSNIEDSKNKIVTDYRDIKAIKEEQSELSDKIASLIQKIDKLEAYEKIIEQKNKLEQKQKDVILKREPRFPDGDLGVLKKELLDVSIELSELQKKKSLVESGKCPTCGQDYNLCGSIEDFELSVSELEQVKYEKDIQLRSIEKAIEDYNEIKRYNENAKNTISLLQDQIDQIKEDLKVYDNFDFEVKEVIQEKIKNLEETYIVLDVEIEKSEQIVETNTKNKNYNRDLNYELQNALKEIESLKVVSNPIHLNAPETFNQIFYEEICLSVTLYEKAFSEYNNAVEYNNMLKDMEKNNTKKVEANYKVLDDLRNKSILKDRTKKIIEKDFSSWLIDRGNQFIKKSMNDFFNKSYGKFQIDLVADGKTVDFVYTEDGDNYLNVNLASGFEKEVISYAFRSALNSMGNLGFMITDEIDSFSSEENSLRLYETILQEDFEQLFSISHYPDTKEYLIHSGAKIVELFDGKLK